MGVPVTEDDSRRREQDGRSNKRRKPNKPSKDAPSSEAQPSEARASAQTRKVPGHGYVEPEILTVSSDSEPEPETRRPPARTVPPFAPTNTPLVSTSDTPSAPEERQNPVRHGQPVNTTQEAPINAEQPPGISEQSIGPSCIEREPTLTTVNFLNNNARVLRSRPWIVCNTSALLFKQALVCGVLPQGEKASALLAAISVGELEEVLGLMQGDEEDFEKLKTVVEQAEAVKGEGRVVVEVSQLA